VAHVLSFNCWEVSGPAVYAGLELIAQGGPMKQNVTLSIDKDLLKKGKVIASKRETSLNRMLGDYLKQIVEADDYYEQAKRKALSFLDKGYHLGGAITYKREDLHER
jgi:hypothetical protein